MSAFDKIIEIEAPRGADAEKIVAHYLSGKSCVGEMDTRAIARLMHGRSCAEMETVINEAGLYAGYERAEKITMDHYMAACMRTIYGVSGEEDRDEDRCVNLNDGSRVLSQIIYHEAGHVTVSEVLCPGCVTLSSARGGNNSGGFTTYYRDPKWEPMTWAQRQIIGSLGGMAAVEQKFGICGLGCGRDLDQAFDEVRSLVINNCVCGFHLHGSNYEDSQSQQQRQEQAVAAEIERYYRRAREILALNREFFERIAQGLAEKGLLTVTDIRRFREECQVLPAAV